MVREKETKLYGHTMWITWLLFYMLCKQHIWGSSLESQGLILFFSQVIAVSLQFQHSPAYDKPLLEGGKAQFHSIIDLSDKNLINLLYKLLKQSKRNELTWYIQHWLPLSKNWTSALSTTTAVIQFFQKQVFPLIRSTEIVQLKMYFR